MIVFDPPPNGFSTGKLYTNYLRIYFLPAEGDRLTDEYFIYDQKGFLCRTDDEEEVIQLLTFQAQRPSETSSYGAREAIVLDEWPRRKAALSRRDADFGKAQPPRKQITGLSLKDLEI